MYEMKKLGRMKRLDENAPEAMTAFWTLDKAVFEPTVKGLEQIVECLFAPISKMWLREKADGIVDTVILNCPRRRYVQQPR